MASAPRTGGGPPVWTGRAPSSPAPAAASAAASAACSTTGICGGYAALPQLTSASKGKGDVSGGRMNGRIGRFGLRLAAHAHPWHPPCPLPRQRLTSTTWALPSRREPLPPLDQEAPVLGHVLRGIGRRSREEFVAVFLQLLLVGHESRDYLVVLAGVARFVLGDLAPCPGMALRCSTAKTSRRLARLQRLERLPKRRVRHGVLARINGRLELVDHGAVGWKRGQAWACRGP